MGKLVVTFSTSSMDTLQECFRKWKLEKVENWRKINGSKNPQLSRGEVIHAMLHVWYEQRINGKPEDIQACIEEGAMVFASTGFDNFPLIVKVFNEYVENFRQDTWQPLFSEAPFSVKLYEDSDMAFLFEGKVDLGVNTETGVQIVDHKTSETPNEPPQVTSQMLAYCWALGTKRIVINSINVAPKATNRFHRYLRSFSEDQITEWHRNTLTWAVMAGKMLLENTNLYSQSQCWKCQFKDVCAADPAGRKFRMEAFFTRGASKDLFYKEEKEEEKKVD